VFDHNNHYPDLYRKRASYTDTRLWIREPRHPHSLQGHGPPCIHIMEHTDEHDHGGVPRRFVGPVISESRDNGLEQPTENATATDRN
jgi:hypothetical protein